VLAVGADAYALLELGALLLGFGLAAHLADRWGLSPIPFYLLAGLVMGQISDDPVSFSPDVVETAADVGLVLLLFTLGLEYTGEDLLATLRQGRPAAVLDGLFNFTPGLLAAILLGWSLEAAILLGGITYVSSSGVVSKLVRDLGRLGNRETPLVLSVLVLEDLAMAVYLPLVAVLLVGAGPAQALVLLAIAAGFAVVAVAGMARYGRWVSRVLADRSDEVLLLATMGIALLFAAAAEAAQLSAGIGAFLAGIALTGPAAERARVTIAPLRDLFAAAFFVLFAVGIDAGTVAPLVPVAVALAVVTAATKMASAWRSGADLGLGSRACARAGTVLVPRGEFSIVIAGLGVAAGVESDLAALAAAYVLITAFGGSFLTRASDRIAALATRGTIAGASSGLRRGG
jgi:monovalent cation:H+ antiporter-2, CPA2 family